MELNNLNEEFNLSSLSNISENENKDFMNNIENKFNNNLSISSINYSNENSKEEEVEIIIQTEKKHKKRNKDELNLTPLPIFSCIYCSNDKIAFSHLSKEIFSEKYLFQTSNYDIQELNKLINDSLIEKDIQDDKLIKIIIENTEYFKKYFFFENSMNFFNSNQYKLFCVKNHNYINQYLNNKLENSINRKKNEQIFKEIKLIPKNSNYNKSLFNTTNSLVNNIAAFNIQENNINNNKNSSNISDSNFNSISLNYDNYSQNNNNIKLLNVNSIGMDFIVENIDKDSEEEEEDFLNFFKFDLRRKINHDDINWEEKYFDIWNPIFSDDENDNKLINRKNNIEVKFLINKNSSNSFQLNNINKYKNFNDSLHSNKRYLNLSNKERNKNKIKTQQLDKLLNDKVDYIQKINKVNIRNLINNNNNNNNIYNNYNTLNKTILKIRDFSNEINSKNQGSTQYESKFSNLSNNKYSFFDKNQSNIFGVNSFNFNSLLNLNLSQNYPLRLKKVLSINKNQNNQKKNFKIKRKMENILDLINFENPKNPNLKVYNNKRNYILSNSFKI